MNGDDPYSVDPYYDYPAVSLPTETPPGYFDMASGALSKIFSSSVTPSTPIYTNDYPYGGGTPTLGGTIMDAIYAYGAGKVTLAQTKLRNAVLNTGEGKRIVGAAQAQTLKQYLPMVVVGALVLVLMGGMLFKR